MTHAMKIYPDRATQAQSLADLVAEQIRAAIAANGRADIALPGGSTPVAFLEALSGAALPWDKVTVFPSDERWVPPDHPRSNAGLLRRHLLQGPAAAARIVDFWTGDATPEDGLPALTERLAPHLPPSVLVVGMGDDLHFAGLFPHSPGIAKALAAGAPPVVAMQGLPVAPGAKPEQRVSLSLPPMLAAGHRHLLITGEDKRATLERARALPPDTDATSAPITAMLPALMVHWAP